MRARSRFLWAAPFAIALLVSECLDAQSAAAMPRPVRMREFDGWSLPFVGMPGYSPPCDANTMLLPVDIDGDGDMDVVVAPHSARDVRIFMNDGFGGFSEESQARVAPLAPGPRGSWTIDAGDIDGDGDLDLVTGTAGPSWAPRYHQGIVYINDGTAHFADESDRRLPDIVAFPYRDNHASRLADYDGDGDLDLALSGPRTDRSLRILRNDGRGYFVFDPSASPVDGGWEVSVSGYLIAQDLDSDGDLDLVGSGAFGGISLWLNDGAGRFVSGRGTRFSPTNLASAVASVAVGDVDGDGDLDIAAGAAYQRRPINLFLNDGSGHFQDVSWSHVDATSLSDANLRLADFDGDGDLDMLCVLFSASMAVQGGEQFLRNDGNGHFALGLDQTDFQRHPNGGVINVAVADFDRDGDLDAMIPDGGAQTTGFATCRTRYLVNTTRQLTTHSSPTLGGSWRLAAHGEPGSSVLVLLALGTARIDLRPFGQLGLDPSSLVAWPQVLAIDEHRTQSLDIPIPALSGLRGASIYAQSLHSRMPGDHRLGNVCTATIQ